MSWSPRDYDHVVVSFSGGKDSIACVKACLDAGVDPRRIRLYHQLVDGQGPPFMDWPVTHDYCRSVGAALGIPVFFQWREGGFHREMWRDNQRTAPVYFEKETGGIGGPVGGTRGPLGTRGMFPQVSANLGVRWCSSALKIDPCASAIRNQPVFDNAKTLVVSGERAGESAARAKYKEFEVDRADARGARRRRHVDRWRPVHQWDEQAVWDAMADLRLVPHPAYRLGWGRLSCMACIFGSKDQWASVRAVSGRYFDRIAEAERKTGKTIHRTQSVLERAAEGTPYGQVAERGDLVAMAMATTYLGPVKLAPGEEWILPAGAFGDGAGPV